MSLKLPRDRDFIFEPGSLDTLSPCAHIIDADMSHVFVRNDTDVPVVLNRNQLLGNVSEYELAGCFPVSPEDSGLASKAPTKSTRPACTGVRHFLAAAAAFTAAVTPQATETAYLTGVTIYGSTPQSVNSIKPGQTRVYPVGQKDKDVIDQEFDKLQAQGRMEWTPTSTPFSFPCFVVWKNTPVGPKGRVVVDIRALNRITMPDAYPVPLQAEILSLLRNAPHISTVDAASFFYQWWVKEDHRYRLTVSSHHGQETSKVPVMGFKNSPAYVQRMIDGMLRAFRHICRAYVDDIVIFSTTLEQ